MARIDFATVTDSEGTTRIINAPTLEEGGSEISSENMAKAIEDAFERVSNGNRTSFERDSNDDRTIDEQEPNDEQTWDEQETNDDQAIIQRRKNQTAAANNENNNRIEIKPKDYCELRQDIIALLDSPKFIKKITKRRTLKYIYSVPEPVRLAICKELGRNITEHEMNKTRFSMMYQKRFSPWTFWSVVVAAVTILLLVIWPASPKPTGEKAEKEVVAAAVSGFDLKAEVRKWEKKNRYFFSGWRLSHDIQNCKISDADELAKFLQGQKQVQGSSFTEPQKW